MFNGQMTGVLAGDLVGRASAIDTIENAIGQERAGGGTCLVLVGEPGVGKSRLVREASRLSDERSMRTFVGRAVADHTPPRES